MHALCQYVQDSSTVVHACPLRTCESVPLPALLPEHDRVSRGTTRPDTWELHFLLRRAKMIIEPDRIAPPFPFQQMHTVSLKMRHTLSV